MTLTVTLYTQLAYFRWKRASHSALGLRGTPFTAFAQAVSNAQDQDEYWLARLLVGTVKGGTSVDLSMSGEKCAKRGGNR